MADPEIHDNADRHQYELPVEGEIAVVTYYLSPRNLVDA